LGTLLVGLNGCAAGLEFDPLHEAMRFQGRPTPATFVQESFESLRRKGYVEIGLLHVWVPEGADREAWTRKIQIEAARHGGDLIQLPPQPKDISLVSVWRRGFDSDVNVNARDHVAKTPLMRAAYAGQTAIVRALLAKGADVNARDKYDGTPLIDAGAAGALGDVQIV